MSISTNELKLRSCLASRFAANLDHIAICIVKVDPDVVVANWIRDEYFREAIYRYVRVIDGQICEYVSKLPLPKGNYHSEAGRKRLDKFEKQ